MKNGNFLKKARHDMFLLCCNIFHKNNQWRSNTWKYQSSSKYAISISCVHEKCVEKLKVLWNYPISKF
jgi:hypothetical protein